MTDGLVWERRPDLRQPLLVAAFSGWNDAGDAATGAADWLIRQRDPLRIAGIEPDEHLDYQSHRPHIDLVDGVARSITWPANDCFAVTFEERDGTKSYWALAHPGGDKPDFHDPSCFTAHLP